MHKAQIINDDDDDDDDDEGIEGIYFLIAH